MPWWKKRCRRSLWAALLVAGAVGAFPSVATAGVASSTGGTATFVDPGGADDDLDTILNFVPASRAYHEPADWIVSFHDAGTPVVPGAGCAKGSSVVVCQFEKDPPAGIDVDLGGGADRLRLVFGTEVTGVKTRVAIDGGPGADVISTVRAGAEIDGGPGDDLIEPDEPEVFTAPAGPTPGGVISGGAGNDSVYYGLTPAPIRVSLDGSPNDGRKGEGDDVRPDVENVTGGPRGNVLTGSLLANFLVGGNRDDVITGGRGRDILEGGGGDDTLDALDGSGGDGVACEEGSDVAFVDGGDPVGLGQLYADPATCEKVIYAPRLSTPELRWRSGRIAVSLRCPGASVASCRGKLRLTTDEGKTIASAAYRVKRGKDETLDLKAARTPPAEAVLFIAPKGRSPVAGRSVSVSR